jgi:CheY-like chemotaxis protein
LLDVRGGSNVAFEFIDLSYIPQMYRELDWGYDCQALCGINEGNNFVSQLTWDDNCIFDSVTIKMKTILVIEDNLEIRENISEILELEGFKVIVAMEGKTGLDVATRELPDIILCDIMMPGLDGYGVLKAIKSNSETKYIPFIYVTASAEKSEVRLAMDMGADGYVRKPFDTDELLDAINKFAISK